MSINAQGDLAPSLQNVEKAKRWMSLTIFSSLAVSITCLFVVVAPNLPLSSVTIDVAQTFSNEALIICFCALMSLVNAYSAYQLTSAVSTTADDF